MPRGGTQVFNSVTTFDKWFNAPFESYKVVSKEDMALNEEEQLYLISRLHSILEPFMLRCATAGRNPAPARSADARQGAETLDRGDGEAGGLARLGASRRTWLPSFLTRSKRSSSAACRRCRSSCTRSAPPTRGAPRARPPRTRRLIDGMR